ncbi:HNH endonuclease [Flavobacterium soyangense]|uniref:HNH nuclease domain-containing protein n=1 Tax=Flavobacterium soyangense TaxID=2023265 RepID=A0A930UD02_9FLAO|nr:hypothetical protein [Flavobacterium soyangense]MBF2708567.1 hypothetical protein [Flavobacterium soyangense]
MIKINPSSNAIEFHRKKASKYFEDLVSKGYILRDKKQKNICKTFLIFLTKYKDELINAMPNRLLEIHQEFENKNFSKHQLTLIKSFFLKTCYDNFPNKEFLNHLKIDTCVYCNRNYTLYFGGNNARAELDHWYPKEKFPILAMSFYNLIPSCHSCNHIKGNGDVLIRQLLKEPKANQNEIKDWWKNALDNLNHPYLECSKFKFSYSYISINNFGVELKKTNNIKTENTLEFNKTKEIYSANSNKELKDLLDLRYKYSENYIDVLINKTFKGIMSKEEIYRMIFGIEIKEEDYHKRPFSKFKHDIIEELKNIK